MTNLRRYARQTTTRLIIGFLVLLILVGDGLVYSIYGRNAAITGLLCLGLGLAPLALIWLILIGLEWWAKRD